jgi:hypothetical protein
MSDVDDARFGADPGAGERESEEAGDLQYDEAQPAENTEAPDNPVAQGTGAEPPD